MALERIYTIPLRREFMKAPNYRKTKRSVSAVREFLQKHMKCKEVKIGKYLNFELWKHGRKNPPAKIQVKAIKDKVKIKDKSKKRQKQKTSLSMKKNLLSKPRKR